MKREEIDSQLPMPLYLGLMGTMLGIITGIGGIALKMEMDLVNLLINQVNP